MQCVNEAHANARFQTKIYAMCSSSYHYLWPIYRAHNDSTCRIVLRQTITSSIPDSNTTARPITGSIYKCLQKWSKCHQRSFEAFIKMLSKTWK